MLRLSVATQINERIHDLAWGRLASGQKTAQQKYNHSTGYNGEFVASPAVSFAQGLEEQRQQFQKMKYSITEEEEEDEMGGSMHLALRVPANKGKTIRDPYSNTSNNNKPNCPSKNALDEIHKEWKRIQTLTSSLRQGSVRGATGLPLCDVLVVSVRGKVVPSALEFVYRSLLQDGEAGTSVLVDSSLVTPQKADTSPLPSSKNNVEYMASTLQNIVRTPFKSSGGKSSEEGNAIGHNSSHSSIRKRKLRVLTSVDPSAMNEALCDLSPATTMVITLSLEDKEEECKQLTLLARSWLLRMGVDDTDSVVQKHMYLVTAKDKLKKSSSKNTFLIPKHSRCEAFSSLSAAGLLVSCSFHMVDVSCQLQLTFCSTTFTLQPLSMLFGWEVVFSLLSGAHDIDQHFVETNPRHNLPVILALTDVWNDAFMMCRGRVMSPFLQAFASYPKYVGMLENRVLGGRKIVAQERVSFQAKPSVEGASPVIDGGYNLIHDRGDQKLSSELITALDPTKESNVRLSSEEVLYKNNDSRICSMFGYADVLAFGSGGVPTSNNRRSQQTGGGVYSPGSPPVIQSMDSMQSVGSFIGKTDSSRGNHPSTLIICGKCDAFAVGQLLALAEHRALVKAWLWDVDPFAVFTTTEQNEHMKEKLNEMNRVLLSGGDLDDEDEEQTKGGEDSTYLATKTILKAYADRTQNYR